MFEKEDEITWAETFFKENFSVDKFLSGNTNKSDLASLRQSLKKYGSQLHKCMSEILKDETEAIVNLAEALSDLTSKIDNLGKPTSQLQEEIKALFLAIQNIQARFEQHKKKVNSAADKNEFLTANNRLMTTCINVGKIIDDHLLQEDVDLLYLERAINAFSYEKQYFYLKNISVAQDETVSLIENKLNTILDESFIKSVKNKDYDGIHLCLQMYINLHRLTEAQQIYREFFVRKSLQQIFNQKNFDMHSQQLSELYAQAISYISKEMDLIIKITKENEDLRCFNFVINSFWKETDALLKENLSNVTAPGNPELFHSRFKHTWNFICHILSMNGSKLARVPSILDHIKRFNLPVYFEIRYQQIAGSLEREIISNTTLNGNFKCENGVLKVTAAFWKCFEECFHEDIYIEHLTGNFVKLSQLVLSRYLRCIEDIISRNLTAPEELISLEEFIIAALSDLQETLSKLCIAVSDVDGLALSPYKIIPLEMRLTILDILKLNHISINETKKKLCETMIQLKLRDALEKLQDVTSVPRLYRRTNRNVPTEVSLYITSAVDPVVKFSNVYSNLIKEHMNFIIDSLIEKMALNYTGLVQEVLHSVGKTEKSLRRLKNRSYNMIEDAANQNMDISSDEGKIREQIRLDVHYFSSKLTEVASEHGKQLLGKFSQDLKNTF